MMHGVVVGLQLFAARDSAETWGRFDHFGKNEFLILGAVTLLVIVTIVWQVVSGRSKRDFGFNSPPRLFAELCRAHKLNHSNRRLLKKLAAARGLASAAALFVEPECFDMTNVPSALKPFASELRQLRHVLFD